MLTALQAGKPPPDRVMIAIGPDATIRPIRHPAHRAAALPPAQLIPKGVMSASAAGAMVRSVIRAEEGSAMSNDASSRAGRQTSGAAVGFILFAAIMMIMSGVFQALQGLVAIFENEFYVATRNYTFQFDATTWGWIHLLVGLLVAVAGYGLLSGRTWARTVAIFLAVLSAI